MADANEVYQQERLFIARCGDVHALLDRMAEYRDAQATAKARGLTDWRMRMGDLLELAEARVVQLKVRATPRSAPRPEPRREQPLEQSVRHDPVPDPGRTPQHHVQAVRPVAAPVNARPTDPRRAEYQPPPRIESRPAALPPTRPASQGSTAPSVPHRVHPASAQRSAPAPGGAPKPPLTGGGATGGIGSDVASGLTGADLARWRAQRGLTQRVAAELLGVAHGTVGKAELLPGKPLGEALSAALGRVRAG